MGPSGRGLPVSTLVGRTSLRHRLNDRLLVAGGHIGFGVRPAFRRNGYATAILRGSLRIAGLLGIDRALLTCDQPNAGSARVIERCGGVLESIVPVPDGPPVCRYWIQVRGRSRVR